MVNCEKPLLLTTVSWWYARDGTFEVTTGESCTTSINSVWKRVTRGLGPGQNAEAGNEKVQPVTALQTHHRTAAATFF
jgi:hypothetical protein